MRKTAIFLAAPAFLASCGDDGGDIAIRPMASPADSYQAIIAPGTAPADIESAARNACSSAAICQVIGWADPANAATRLPMLDREAATVVFNYQVNRQSGAETAFFRLQPLPYGTAEKLPLTNRSINRNFLY